MKHFVQKSSVFVLLILTAFAWTSISGAQTVDNPEPGKQVVGSVNLPASTSVWKWGAEGMKNIGEPRPVDESKTEDVRYWIFLPKDYETQAKNGGAPLFLFLHGAGERGDSPGEIGKVKVHGPPKFLDDEKFNKNWPCVTVSPQCKNEFAWSPAQLMLLLDHVEKEYKIDKNRIYVSGISMGGFGSWMCLQENPKRFAAAAPICGGAKLEWAGKVKDVPIWNFHGDRDTVVPFDLSVKMVDAIRKADGKKIIFTVYEGVGHDAWTKTYDNQLLYDWIFSHSL